MLNLELETFLFALHVLCHLVSPQRGLLRLREKRVRTTRMAPICRSVTIALVSPGNASTAGVGEQGIFPSGLKRLAGDGDGGHSRSRKKEEARRPAADTRGSANGPIARGARRATEGGRRERDTESISLFVLLKRLNQ